MTVTTWTKKRGVGLSGATESRSAEADTGLSRESREHQPIPTRHRPDARRDDASHQNCLFVILMPPPWKTDMRPPIHYKKLHHI